MESYCPEVRLVLSKEKDNNLMIVYCDEVERGRICKEDTFKVQYNNGEKSASFDTFQDALFWLIPDLEM